MIAASGPPIAAADVHPTPVIRRLSLVWRANRRLSPQARRFIELTRASYGPDAPAA